MTFVKIYCLGALVWAGSVAAAQAQVAGPAADSSQRFVLRSGQRKALFWSLAPGEGYALRFVPPAASQGRLVSIRLFLQPFGSRAAQGQVRVRVATVGPGGAPAGDDLLAAPLLVTTPVLQALEEPLLLAWPGTRLVVPPGGCFIVVEGVGEAPDEYVLRSPRLVVAGPGNHQIGRRRQPGAAPRLVSTFSIPEMWSAKPLTAPVDFWAYGGEPAQWRPYSTSKRVPLLEVRFE